MVKRSLSQARLGGLTSVGVWQIVVVEELCMLLFRLRMTVDCQQGEESKVNDHIHLKEFNTEKCTISKNKR